MLTVCNKRKLKKFSSQDVIFISTRNLDVPGFMALFVVSVSKTMFNCCQVWYQGHFVTAGSSPNFSRRIQTPIVLLTPFHG